MSKEVIASVDVFEVRKPDLSNNGTQFAGGCRYAMCCRTVTSGEGFTRDNKSRGIGTKILEEVGNAVEEYEGSSAVSEDNVITESQGDEDNSKHNEPHELNGFASPLRESKYI